MATNTNFGSNPWLCACRSVVSENCRWSSMAATCQGVLSSDHPQRAEHVAGIPPKLGTHTGLPGNKIRQTLAVASRSQYVIWDQKLARFRQVDNAVVRLSNRWPDTIVCEEAGPSSILLRELRPGVCHCPGSNVNRRLKRTSKGTSSHQLENERSCSFVGIVCSHSGSFQCFTPCRKTTDRSGVALNSKLQSRQGKYNTHVGGKVETITLVEEGEEEEEEEEEVTDEDDGAGDAWSKLDEGGIVEKNTLEQQGVGDESNRARHATRSVDGKGTVERSTLEEEEVKNEGDGAEDAMSNEAIEEDYLLTAEPILLSKDISVKEKLRLAWRALKLPIYSVAVLPILMGGALAYYETGILNFQRLKVFLVPSFLVMTWLHFSNDYYDSLMGVDKNKRESFVNLIGRRAPILVAGFALLGMGLLNFYKLGLTAGDHRISLFLSIAIACGYVYQCPPFRLSYVGLGEPLCFVAFGISTVAFYLGQVQPSLAGSPRPISLTAWGASVLLGMTTSLILFCSHFHQIDDDRAAGKMSPMVRLGSTEKGAAVVSMAVPLIYGAGVALVLFKVLPLTSLLGFILSSPVARVMKNYIVQNYHNQELIFKAKYYAVRLHVTFGLLLALSLVASRRFPSFCLPW